MRASCAQRGKLSTSNTCGNRTVERPKLHYRRDEDIQHENFLVLTLNRVGSEFALSHVWQNELLKHQSYAGE